MSCYTRHLGDLFKHLGIEDNKENRRIIDLKIREALGLGDMSCPQVWRDHIKPILTENARFEDLAERLSRIL